MIIVIYHGNCYDGITAAYVTWLHFGANAEYLPFNYSDAPPDVEQKEVYIVDFSFKRDILLKMVDRAKFVKVLDHHKSAEEDLKGLNHSKLEIVFDMERSGAGITWDYFFGAPRNLLVNYIEDRDLWRYNLPNSRELNAWIQSFDIDLHTWISHVGPNFSADKVSNGKDLLRQQAKLVKSICANAKMKPLPFLNDNMGLTLGIYVQTSILQSEVCEQMLKDHPEAEFAFYSFERADGKIQFGLRSRKNGTDVSELAKQYGGGGHHNAAGFEI